MTNAQAQLLLNTDHTLSDVQKRDILQTLNHLAAGLEKTLGMNLASVVLYGSLCSGDFNPSTSDIDLVVLTQKPLEQADYFVLSHLHNSLKVREPVWGNRLDVIYASAEALQSATPPHAPVMHVVEGHVQEETLEAIWYLIRHAVHVSGLVIYGQALDKAALEARPTKLRVAAYQVLMTQWQPVIHRGMHHVTQDALKDAVLSLCRLIACIEDGVLLSKREAGRHVIKQGHTGFEDVVESALSADGDLEVDRQRVYSFMRSVVTHYVGMD